MAGIVISNKVRRLIGNRLKEIDVPTATLDTALYYADLTAQGASFTQSRVNTELNAYPTTVKNNASIVLTPGARKDGIIYAMNGDTKTIEEFEFQRGSSGTYFGAGGTMQLADPNVPRVNFENGVSKGLLIEPSSSNLLTDSGILNGLNSFPSKTALGLTAVDTNFNLGALLSKGVQISNDEGSAYAYKQVEVDDNKSCVLSVFVKMSDSSKPVSSDFAFVQKGVVIRFNNQNVINCGNNVYRVFIAFTTSGASSRFGIVKYAVDNSSKSLIFSGMQLEEGVIPTSYIPTTTSTATRLADKVLSKRPLAVFNKNSFFVKTAEWPSVWFGNGVIGLTILGRNHVLEKRILGLNSAKIVKKDYNGVVYYFRSSVSDITDENIFAPKTVYSVRYILRSLTAINPRLYVRYTDDSFGSLINNVDGEPFLTPTEKDVRSVNVTHGTTGFVELESPKVEPISTSDWTPAPEDYVKIGSNGFIEISYDIPIHIQQFSLISRELTQEEV